MNRDHIRRTLRHAVCLLLGGFLLLSFLTGPPPLSAAGKSQRVLLLCSYHQGDDWSDETVRGVNSVLADSDAELFIQYLDVRRHPEPHYGEGIAALLSRQHRETPFTVIISADDPAFSFLLSRRGSLFPGTPIVFCGVNDFTESRIAGQQGITGVNEAIDLEETIALALKLHPRAQRLVAVTSDLPANGARNRELFQRASPSFSGRIEIRELKNLKVEEAAPILGALSPSSIVLRLSTLIEREREVVDRMTSDRFLAKHSPAPVYSLWSTSIGTGIVGGIMVDGFLHGEAAAKIARRILRGESASAIPVVMKSPNAPLFDWQAMERFRIAAAELPAGSRVENKPFSLYENYKHWIWVVLGLLILQTWLIALLLLSRHRLVRTQRELRRSESLFQELFDDAPVGYIEYDPEGRITTSNRTALEMLGYTSRNDLVGELIWNLSRGEEIVRPQVLAKLKGEQPPGRNLERTYRRKDGTTFPALVEDRLVLDEQGGIRGIRCTIQDITERKKSEEENRVIAELGQVIGSTLNLTEVYERLTRELGRLIPYDRLLINLKENHADDFTVAYVAGADNPRRRLGDSYPAGGTATGVVMKTRRGILVQPTDPEEIRAAYPNLFQTFTMGLRSTMSVPLISLDEVIGSMTFRSRKLHAYSERDLHLAERIGMQIAGAIANARLFTNLARAEQSQRQSQKQLTLAQQIAHLGSWKWQIRSNRLEVSDEMYRIIGIDRDTFTGDLSQLVEQLVHPDDRPAIERSILAARQGVKTGPAEYRILYPDRSVHWIWMEAGELILDNDGTPDILTGIVLDITDRKQLEETHRMLQERLRQAEKMEALGTLAGGVAHDLNNVLGIVVGYSEMLLEKLDRTNPVRSDLMKIMDGGARAAAIVQDLLTLARRGVQTRTPVNLNATVAECRRTPEFEKLFAFNPLIRLRIELDEGLLDILGSPVHLGKTLLNLVSNAVEAMPDGGTVTIATQNRYLDTPVQGYDHIREGDYALLVVSDTGEGISAADLTRIFEPFYTKKVMGRSGTGLGLAVVWGTVKDHNGYIDVQSEPRKGSTFTLYFPVTRQERPPDRTAVPLSAYLGKGESLLVVDDVEGQRDLAVRMLTRLNYRVASVPSGEAAVEHLTDHQVDLVVLDMIMEPGMDGLDTYRRMLTVRPGLKAIIVSGFSETERVAKTQALGAGEYVRKPYLIEKIGMAVRRELDSG
ncbi:MAG: ABC transporter substrate binding protein [Syntrophales bacterium]